MSKKKVFGTCRVCGLDKKLTQEHYIPRAAGGAMKTKIYAGDELLKSVELDDDGNNYKPRHKLSQSGLMDYTLCKQCNEYSGINYDKDFSLFYNVVQFGVYRNIDIPENISTTEYLLDKTLTMSLKDMRPFNIAKRILVSFCTVEHKGLTSRIPEIRKAILDKDYTPEVDTFKIFLGLHTGNSAYYGTIAALKGLTEPSYISAYAGIESDFLAFYFTSHADTMKRGLEGCIDITNWLTDYGYNQTTDLNLTLEFNQTKHLLFPIN